MNIHFLSFYAANQMGASATGPIAHFLVSVAALIVVAECSLRPPLALPQSPKNAHSNLSN